MGATDDPAADRTPACWSEDRRVASRLAVLLGAGLLMAGCDGSSSVATQPPPAPEPPPPVTGPSLVETPVFSGSFDLPDRQILKQLGLPPGPDGRGFALLTLNDGVYGFDPDDRTPVSAAAECAAGVLSCFHPQLRNYAGCFANVPVCSTDTPWTSDGPACCAAACGGRYQDLLREGRDPPSAMTAAIYEKPSCMPGVEGYEP